MINGNITLKKLQIFLSFMSKGNIALVAESIGLSTVSVHRALHTLEEDIACPLFIHKGRILQPLPAAHTLVEYAKEIIELTERAIENTCQAAGMNKARLRIGCMYSLTLETVPKLMMDFKRRQPNVAVDLMMGSNQDLLERLESGQLDAILIAISESSIDKNTFEVLPLFQDALYIAGPIDSPLLAGESVCLQDFKHQHFIALSEGFATYHSFHQAFADTDFDPYISLYVKDIFSLINLVQAGVGFSLLPGRIMPAYTNTIKMLPLSQANPINQTIGLTFLKTREHEPYLRALVASSRMYALTHNTVTAAE
ncbi:LysR family transcriptional regulator [Utexia brackfieldae]|uniref:LysR family transcriptional regulator n=1 Tax=Utexia brackfieldae TaxID=3074108 RepID=UPI00370DBAC5